MNKKEPVFIKSRVDYFFALAMLIFFVICSALYISHYSAQLVSWLVRIIFGVP